MKNKLNIVIAGLILVLILALTALYRIASPNRRAAAGPDTVAPEMGAPSVTAATYMEHPGLARVTYVLDGDTIVVDYKNRYEHVRFLRIDTPEWYERGYEEATEALRGLIEGKWVRLEFEESGIERRDVYGRLLAYVFLDSKNINLEMVRRGWTPFWTKYGAGRYAADFREAEKEAREFRRGLW
jgi:micrococcal nuclease